MHLRKAGVHSAMGFQQEENGITGTTTSNKYIGNKGNKK